MHSFRLRLVLALIAGVTGGILWELAKRLWQVSMQIVQRITNATRTNSGGYLIRREAIEH